MFRRAVVEGEVLPTLDMKLRSSIRKKSRGHDITPARGAHFEYGERTKATYTGVRGHERVLTSATGDLPRLLYEIGFF